MMTSNRWTEPKSAIINHHGTTINVWRLIVDLTHCLVFIDRLTVLDELTMNREYTHRVERIRMCQPRTQLGLARKLRTELRKLDRQVVVELKDGPTDCPTRGIWLQPLSHSQ
jgi:hypothetical protein